MIIKPGVSVKKSKSVKIGQEDMMIILADVIYNNVYYCLDLEDLAHIATILVRCSGKEIKFFIGGNMKIVAEEFAFIRAFRYFLSRKNSSASIIFAEVPDFNSRFMQMLIEHEKENKNLVICKADSDQLYNEKYFDYFLLSDGKKFCYTNKEKNLSSFAKVKQDHGMFIESFQFFFLFINWLLGIKRPKDEDYLYKIFQKIKEKSDLLI